MIKCFRLCLYLNCTALYLSVYIFVFVLILGKRKLWAYSRMFGNLDHSLLREIGRTTEKSGRYGVERMQVDWWDFLQQGGRVFSLNGWGRVLF